MNNCTTSKINFFCYHHHWIKPKRLEYPINFNLSATAPDIIVAAVVPEIQSMFDIVKY